MILARFADPAGGFFDTADDHETLVTRPKDVQDNAVPAGGSMAAIVLLRLAALTGEARYRDAAERAIGAVTAVPGALPHRIRELAVGGAPRASRASTSWRSSAIPRIPATRALLDVASDGYRPNLVLAVAADPAASAVPLLAGREAIGGRPTAYLCRDFACRLPVTDAAALRAAARRRGRRPVIPRTTWPDYTGRRTVIVVPLLSPSGSWFAAGM